MADEGLIYGGEARHGHDTEHAGGQRSYGPEELTIQEQEPSSGRGQQR